MSAILLTYSNQRETSVREQKTRLSLQPVLVCRHSRDLESKFKGKNGGVPETMHRELGLLRPDARSHTNGGKERRRCAPSVGGEASFHLQSGQRKSSGFTSNRRRLRHHAASSTRLWCAEEARLLPPHECIHYDAAPPNYLRGKLGIATGVTCYKLTGKFWLRWADHAQPTAVEGPRSVFIIVAIFCSKLENT